MPHAEFDPYSPPQKLLIAPNLQRTSWQLWIVGIIFAFPLIGISIYGAIEELSKQNNPDLAVSLALVFDFFISGIAIIYNQFLFLEICHTKPFKLKIAYVCISASTIVIVFFGSMTILMLIKSFSTTHSVSQIDWRPPGNFFSVIAVSVFAFTIYTSLQMLIAHWAHSRFLKKCINPA